MKSARERDQERMADIRAREAKAEAARQAEIERRNAKVLADSVEQARAHRETNMDRERQRRADAAAERRSGRGRVEDRRAKGYRP